MSTPVYHGNDLSAAYERARAEGGAVILSTPPASGTKLPACLNGMGYWSDNEIGMVRTWEREVWAVGQRKSLPQLFKQERRLGAIP